MSTNQQLQHTVETLTELKTQYTETDTETYTVDYIIDTLIRYFSIQQHENDIDPEDAYDRAMKGIK